MNKLNWATKQYSKAVLKVTAALLAEGKSSYEAKDMAEEIVKRRLIAYSFQQSLTNQRRGKQTRGFK